MFGSLTLRHIMGKLFSTVLFAVMLMPTSAHCQRTIWDELPKTQKGRYEFFRKNDRAGVFDAYVKMKGTRYIFACVNAVVFHLYAYQDDAILNEAMARDAAELSCAEMKKFEGMPIAVPLGTPILLRYERFGVSDRKLAALDLSKPPISPLF